MAIEHSAPQGSQGERYERRDANVPALLKIALALLVTIVVAMVSMYGMFHYFAKSQQLGPPASPFEKEDVRVLPPQPRLQVQPKLDLKTYCESQSKDLKSYGWVDEHNGVVRIPVDRAMDLILSRGLPARAAGSSSAVTAADSGSGTSSSPGVSGLEGPCAYVLQKESQHSEKE
jgi:hypothetical protein